MGKTCMSVVWPTPGFNGRTFVSSGFSIEETLISVSAVICRYTDATMDNQIEQGCSLSDNTGWRYVLRADLKVLIVTAFLMCCGSKLQTEGPEWEKTWSQLVSSL